MSFSSKNSWLIVFAFCWALGCDSGPSTLDPTTPGLESFIVSESLLLNPTGYVPLAAELKLETSQPVQVELEILGRDNDTESLTNRFEERATSFALPVLGLYPAHRNTLLIRFYDADDQLLGEENRSIDTLRLLPSLYSDSIPRIVTRC